MFTSEEINELKKNIYVSSVSFKMVRFTPEFKQRFIDEYESGKTPFRIISDMGIDPHILGENRLTGIRQHVQEQSKREIGFKRNILPRSLSLTENQKIGRLEHELTYLRQELEFIKKILYANKKAEQK